MRRSRGFTLLELMIVVAVIAILASIAIYNYTDQIRKARRSQAVQILTDLSLRQEKFRTNNAEFGDIDELDAASLVTTTTSPFYAIEISNLTGTTYTIRATPRVGSAQEDDKCGYFQFAMANGTTTKTAGGGSDCL